jgi:polar amino acid transport system permease protein
MTLALALLSDWRSDLPDLLSGLLVSLKVTGLSLLLGLPLGLAFALLTGSRIPALRWPGVALVEIGRGPPTLVMIYLAYFGLPELGLSLAAVPAAIVALGYNTGAYTSEIFRSGLLAVPEGQREAARALGLGRRSELRDVVLPQAVRVATPPLVGFSITVFQASSLCFVIGVPELLSRAYNIATVSFEYLSVLCLAALLYAAVSIPASSLVNHLERVMSRRL